MSAPPPLPPLPLPNPLPGRRGDVKKMQYPEAAPRKPTELVTDGGANRCVNCHQVHAPDPLADPLAPHPPCIAPQCDSWWICGWLARHHEAQAQYPHRLDKFRRDKLAYDNQQEDLVARTKAAIDERDRREKEVKPVAGRGRPTSTTTISPADFEAIIARSKLVVNGTPKTPPKGREQAIQAARQFQSFITSPSSSADTSADLEASFSEDLPTVTAVAPVPAVERKRTVSDLSDSSFERYYEARKRVKPLIDELIKIIKESQLEEGPELIFDIINKAFASEFPPK